MNSVTGLKRNFLRTKKIINVLTIWKIKFEILTLTNGCTVLPPFHQNIRYVYGRGVSPPP